MAITVSISSGVWLPCKIHFCESFWLNAFTKLLQCTSVLTSIIVTGNDWLGYQSTSVKMWSSKYASKETGSVTLTAFL